MPAQPLSDRRRLLWAPSAVIVCGLLPAQPVCGQDYVTPNNVTHTEQASEETLKQSAGRTALRVFGLDVFPRAAVTATYDDNLLITDSNQLSDVEWSISPGLTVAAGDVSLYLPGSATLGEIRNLMNYSLVDDTSKPERYVAAEYAPSLNFFTDHTQYNDVDHNAGLSAAYHFARLATGLDADYSHLAVKDNDVGDRVTRDLLVTRWRNRYEWTDRSAVEVNCRYTRLDYEQKTFQGYDEFRNEDWFDRKLGARLEVGPGMVFGFVYPQLSPNQTFQQGLVRAIYLLTGKLSVRAQGGVEWRHYETGQSSTLDPAFDVEFIYQPRQATTITLSAHQLTEPSYGTDYNYRIYGFTAGVEQQLSGSLDAELIGGYEHVDYIQLAGGPAQNRSDDTYTIQANLGYEFNSHLKAALFFNRIGDESTVSRYTYANNMAGMRISWRY